MRVTITFPVPFGRKDVEPSGQGVPVWLDGEEVARLRTFETITLDAPDREIRLQVGHRHLMPSQVVTLRPQEGLHELAFLQRMGPTFLGPVLTIITLGAWLVSDWIASEILGFGWLSSVASSILGLVWFAGLVLVWRSAKGTKFATALGEAVALVLLLGLILIMVRLSLALGWDLDQNRFLTGLLAAPALVAGAVIIGLVPGAHRYLERVDREWR
ncbi:MAG: hypothetical protein AAF830_15980 [Pseudomonadota bacterium]